jgi:hypothetical protein
VFVNQVTNVHEVGAVRGVVVAATPREVETKARVEAPKNIQKATLNTCVTNLCNKFLSLI